MLFVPTASSAAPPQELASRAGDNTIYFSWDAGSARLSQATSSRRFEAKQKLELLTRVVDRSGEIVMRAILKNVSQERRYRVDGPLVHNVFRNDKLIKRLETEVFHVVLKPGERIVGRFVYTLETGDYSARTDFERV
jgi:hypothetical protein